MRLCLQSGGSQAGASSRSVDMEADALCMIVFDAKGKEPAHSELEKKKKTADNEGLTMNTATRWH